MKGKIKKLITQYWKKEISQENLVTKFDKILNEKYTNYSDFFESVFENRNDYSIIINCIAL